MAPPVGVGEDDADAEVGASVGVGEDEVIVVTTVLVRPPPGSVLVDELVKVVGGRSVDGGGSFEVVGVGSEVGGRLVVGGGDEVIGGSEVGKEVGGREVVGSGVEAVAGGLAGELGGRLGVGEPGGSDACALIVLELLVAMMKV